MAQKTQLSETMINHVLTLVSHETLSAPDHILGVHHSTVASTQSITILKNVLTQKHVSYKTILETTLAEIQAGKQQMVETETEVQTEIEGGIHAD